MSALPALGADELGFHSRLAPRAWVFRWACLFFGLGEWACEPIFQTLSNPYIYIYFSEGRTHSFFLFIDVYV